MVPVSIPGKRRSLELDADVGGRPELVEMLRDRGGGRGLFPGCAAGDTGAALVVEVDA